MEKWDAVAITGASSGLGRALAVAIARPRVRLALAGRDAARLEETARSCRMRGADVAVFSFDIRDRMAAEAFIAEADAKAPLDMVIASAGINAGTGSGLEHPGQAADIAAVNLSGTLHTVAPALPLMAARGRGHIVVISSLAAFVPLPSTPSYCASKAALLVWMDAARIAYAPSGLTFTTVLPGFVDTPLLASARYPTPFRVTAEQASAIIVEGLRRNRPRIAFPWQLRAAVTLSRLMPDAILAPLLRRLCGTGGADASVRSPIN